MAECKPHFHCFYEEKDTIGKRYRRMDYRRHPFCVTIDHPDQRPNTVTIRYPRYRGQERIAPGVYPGSVDRRRQYIAIYKQMAVHIRFTML